MRERVTCLARLSTDIPKVMTLLYAYTNKNLLKFNDKKTSTKTGFNVVINTTKSY